MHATLEHINLTVSDLKRSIAMLEALFGWQVRWQGTTNSGEPAAHVGGDTSYISLFEHRGARQVRPDQYSAPGVVNHVGVVVEDLDAAEAKVRAIGLTPHAHFDYEPGRRFYFMDPDVVEFEVVSYA